MEHYFIVKINAEKQKERKEKIGSLYLHASHTFMQRNMQQGIIVAIGSIAAKQFPQARINDTLIMHHFVEGSERDGGNFILEENGENYYFVTACEYKGHRCEAYSIFRENKIIPHPDFIFIEEEQIEEGDVDLKELGEEIGIPVKEAMTTSSGGLLLFSHWEETRESKENKATVLLNEIKQGSKGRSISDSAKRGFDEKQNEAGRITASLNKPRYVPYRLLFFNPKLQKSFDNILESGNKIYCNNQAAQTVVEFNCKKYIVVNTKYIGCVSSSLHIQTPMSLYSIEH